MKLYGFAFVLLVSLTSLESCFDSLAAAFGSDIADLAISTNPAEVAARQSAESMAIYRRDNQREGNAFSRNNLAKAENMDFTDMDALVEDHNSSEVYYLHKAAMMVAANRPYREIAALQETAMDRVYGHTNAEGGYLYSYIHSLTLAQSGLQPGTPAYSRVHEELCGNVYLAQAQFPRGLGTTDGRTALVSQGIGSC